SGRSVSARRVGLVRLDRGSGRIDRVGDGHGGKRSGVGDVVIRWRWDELDRQCERSGAERRETSSLQVVRLTGLDVEGHSALTVVVRARTGNRGEAAEAGTILT